MIKYGTYNIGSLYFGSNSIGKAYYGSNLVFQKGGGGEPSIFTKLDYLETNGSSYTLCPVTYASGNAYEITMDMQYLIQADSGKGTGWNAGGAVTILVGVQGSYYGDGAAALSPQLTTGTRALFTVAIGTNGQTVVSATRGGVTSSHTRSNASLASYAGQTGYPLGCMTESGGTVPIDGTAIRFYSVKIMRGSSKVFDAYPVISLEATENAQGSTVPSGTVGFYDKVTRKFYTDLSGQGFTPGTVLPPIFTQLDYLETDGSSYTLCPVTYVSGNAYEITMDMQYLTQADSGKGTGWNAGGAVTNFNGYYSDGSNVDLSPSLRSTNRAYFVVSIGTNGQTTVSARYNGVTSSHTRSNTSLASYAGQTGYPLGCMTESGGTVPTYGTAIRFYLVRIMRGNDRVFDATPVISTEATENAQGVTVPVGTVGFYDRVTGMFYTDLSGQGFTPGYL